MRVTIAAVATHHGSAMVLINWASKPIHNLTVELNFDVDFTSAHLSSGAPLMHTPSAAGGAGMFFTLNLDVADAIVLR